MSLDVKHIDEICQDIRNQCISGVAVMPLFKMTLVPEGNPVIDKVGPFCEKYSLFKDKLSAMGIKSGVLVQATIGHGWTLGKMFPYQRYTNLTDGKEVSVVCPYDKDFQNYIYNVLRTITMHNPDHIMIDDDLRLIGRDGGGCACPLHLKRLNEITKLNLSRESLADIVFKKKESYEEIFSAFVDTQKESLIETAKAIRAGIDSVNPNLTASYCCVGKNAEFAAEIAPIIAGENNDVIIRINNGRYAADGPRFFSNDFFRAKCQIEKLEGYADVILAETDTCPQNRYSTSASSLHMHFTGTILEGATGAKQWITRLASYEPQSGVAYRKILSKYASFYQALADIVPSLKWHGFRMPVLKKPMFKPIKGWNLGSDVTNAWGSCVLERFGIPMYFSSENGGILCLEGEVDALLSDNEITKALKGHVFLASDSVINLEKRGFGKYLGVKAREWNGKQPTSETSQDDDAHYKTQMGLKELVKTTGKTEEFSSVYHSSEYLFPAVTRFKNELGGTVYSFCGTPNTEYSFTTAFSFLTESRKKQIINLVKDSGELPLYYIGDEEIYLKSADVTSGDTFCAIFNIGLDPIERIKIYIQKNVSQIEILTPDGNFENVTYTTNDNEYLIDKQCNILEPVILLIRR